MLARPAWRGQPAGVDPLEQTSPGQRVTQFVLGRVAPGRGGGFPPGSSRRRGRPGSTSPTTRRSSSPDMRCSSHAVERHRAACRAGSERARWPASTSRRRSGRRRRRRRPGARSRSTPSSAQGPCSPYEARSPRTRSAGAALGTASGSSGSTIGGSVARMSNTRAALRRTRCSDCVAAGSSETISNAASGMRATTASTTPSSAPRVTGADPHQQRRPHGEAREQCRQPLADAGRSRAGGGDARQARLVCRRLLKLRVERSEGDQLGGALEEVDHGGGQLSPGRRLSGFRALGQPAGQPWHRRGRQRQGGASRIRPAAGRIHHTSETITAPTISAMANGGITRSRTSCSESTSCTRRARRSPLRKAGRPAGARRLEPLVGAHPQIGEGAECGVVADEALAVAEQGARQGEEVDTDDGQGQGRLGGSLRRARDQPGGRGDQADPCADSSGAQQGGERQPRGSRARELHGGPQRRARPAGGVGRDDPIARRAHVAPTACGPSSTTRSAMLTSAGRWATITAVRPCTSRRSAVEHLLLGGPVEIGRRLVEEQERRVAQERASERDALALADRQSGAALAEHRVQPLGPGRDDRGQSEPVAPPARPQRRWRRGARGGCCRRSSRRTGAGAGAPMRSARARPRGRGWPDRPRPRAPSPPSRQESRAAPRAASTCRIRSGPVRASTSPGSMVSEIPSDRRRERARDR